MISFDLKETDLINSTPQSVEWKVSQTKFLFHICGGPHNTRAVIEIMRSKCHTFFVVLFFKLEDSVLRHCHQCTQLQVFYGLGAVK